MEIILANPRGFCAGVDRAIEMVNRALEAYGAPIYVRHEIVHNQHVVDELRARGAVFVDEVEQIPEGALAIFSAHGVAQRVHLEAKSKALRLFDATCPLVTKVHAEVRKLARDGYDCILIGHAGHPEIEGTMGQFDPSSVGNIFLVENYADVDQLEVADPGKLGYVTQTTLSVDDTKAIIERLQQRFPAIRAPKKDDICYATQNRQDAVRALAPLVDLMLVVGSSNSSNSNRLRELAERLGVRAYLINSAADIQPQWLAGAEKVGVTAGASAPELLVQQVVASLSAQAEGAAQLREFDGVEERVSFAVPKELRLKALESA